MLATLTKILINEEMSDCGGITGYFLDERREVHSLLPLDSLGSVVPRSRFLGDTGVPLPEFQRDICKFWGTHQIHLNFTCKIEYSFP